MKNRFPMTHYEFMKNNGIEFLTNIIFNYYGKNYNLKFDEFTEFFIKLPSVIDYAAQYGLSNLNLFARQIYHYVKMIQSGEKIYYMGPEVCALLKNTRLTIDSEFIESPFEQIYVYTEQENIKIRDNTGEQSVKGLYLQISKENEKKMLRFIATSAVDSIKNGLDINYFASFFIPEHGDLETIANKDIEQFIDSKRVLNADVDLDILKNLFIFSVNILLYIGCKNIDFINFTPENLNEILTRKKNTSKKNKIEKLISRTAQMPFIIVSPKKDNIDKNTIGLTGFKLDHQVLVSGHWRGQWIGPEDNKKKEIRRIQSYVKGLGLKEIESKPFLIK